MMRVVVAPDRFFNTWQDAENLDSTHGYTCYIWIPDEISVIRKLLLHVFLEKFRAYSKSALSGGDRHRHDVNIGVKTAGASPSGETGFLMTASDTKYAHASNDPESALENFTAITSSHSVEVSTKSHTHQVDIGEPTSDYETPMHTHDIEFGIYEEAIAGRVLSAKLYDPDDVEINDFGNIITGEGDLEIDLSTYFQPITKRGLYYINFALSADRARLRSLFLMSGVG